MKLSSLLNEALEHQFKEIDTITIDPDRDDVYDITNKIMPSLIRMAYTHLVADKVSHEKKFGASSDDEDSYNFSFTKSELVDRLETLINNLKDKLDDETHGTELKDSITKMESEFKTPLDKESK